MSVLCLHKVALLAGNDRHIRSNPADTLQLVIASILPLQETELDRFQVPEDAAAEEDTLRAAREAKEKQQIKVRTTTAINFT